METPAKIANPISHQTQVFTKWASWKTAAATANPVITAMDS
jgi:hypothetical protein